MLGLCEVGPRCMSDHTLGRDGYGLEVLQGCPDQGTWSELGGVTIDVNCEEQVGRTRLSLLGIVVVVVTDPASHIFTSVSRRQTALTPAGVCEGPSYSTVLLDKDLSGAARAHVGD